MSENLEKVKHTIPSHVKLVAVSKTKTVEKILGIYNSGHKIFGENKVQELTTKFQALPQDIEWHMIGHLQTNKVRYIAPFVSIIHSVDSLKLLQVIDKEAKKNNRIIQCLFQIKIAKEITKYGLSVPEAHYILESKDYKELKNVQVTGLMGMATYTDDEGETRKEFRTLAGVFKDIKNKYFSTDKSFKELSMGMSHDYKIAIEEGSTIVRIGSLIFGERTYY